MKLAIISDIHLDMNSRFAQADLLPLLLEGLQKYEADLLLIAGDISSHVDSSIRIIDEIQAALGGKLLFIPGNHDIWVQEGETSWENYRRLAEHPACLIDKPYQHDEYIIIGDIGWYDYSYLAEGISAGTMEEMRNDWGDDKYTEWGHMNDEAITGYMFDKLKCQLQKHKDKKVILAIHFVPYGEFLSSKSPYMDWDIYNAFMGSGTFGELLDAHDHIEYVIFGHTHDRHGVKKYRGKTIVCNPLGYISEKSTELFSKELSDSITILDI